MYIYVSMFVYVVGMCVKLTLMEFDKFWVTWGKTILSSTDFVDYGRESITHFNKYIQTFTQTHAELDRYTYVSITMRV